MTDQPTDGRTQGGLIGREVSLPIKITLRRPSKLRIKAKRRRESPLTKKSAPTLLTQLTDAYKIRVEIRIEKVHMPRARQYEKQGKDRKNLSVEHLPTCPNELQSHLCRIDESMNK